MIDINKLSEGDFIARVYNDTREMICKVTSISPPDVYFSVPLGAWSGKVDVDNWTMTVYGSPKGTFTVEGDSDAWALKGTPKEFDLSEYLHQI